MNFNGKGKLVYKCRQCGAIEKTIGVPNLADAIFQLQRRSVYFDEETSSGRIRPAARTIEFHPCGNGLGVMDLIGGELSE